MRRSRTLPALLAAAALMPAAMCAAQPGASAVLPVPPAPAQRVNVSHSDIFGMTPLHWAVVNGLSDEVAELLAAGADPNKIDDSGQTPLLLAAQYGQSDMVQMLLDHGAKANIKDDDKFTAINWSTVFGYGGITLELTSR